VEETRSGQDEFALIDYLDVLFRHRRLIIGITLACGLAAAAVSFIIPPKYKAESRVFITMHNNNAMDLGMLAASASGKSLDFGSNIFSPKSSSELYAGMLQGNTIADRIIDRFNLLEVFDDKYRVDARRDLMKEADISVDKKSDILSIAIVDKSPKRAADIANAFVEELDGLTRNLAVTEAAKRKLYLEEQLEKTRTDLRNTEEDVKEFQEKTGALSIDEQAKAAIEGVAALRAAIAAKEVQLRAMETYATQQNPEFQMALEELAGMRVELAKVEAKGSGDPDPLMPTGNMPGVGTEYLRRAREVKFNEALYSLLRGQYEAAKLDEVRDAVVIQVIDRASPPDKKHSPKRLLIVLLTTASAGLIGVFTAFFKEHLAASRQS